MRNPGGALDRERAFGRRGALGKKELRLSLLPLVPLAILASFIATTYPVQGTGSTH